jgi:type II secretory pathway pseudopilin PulG
MVKYRQKNRRAEAIIAFTLAEVIVAVAVLGISVVAVFGAMRTCSKATHHGKLLNRAVVLAEAQLANVRVSDNPTFGTTEGQSDRFKWQVQLVSTEIEALAAVRVTVTWQEEQRSQQYELLSLLKMKTFEAR